MQWTSCSHWILASLFPRTIIFFLHISPLSVTPSPFSSFLCFITPSSFHSQRGCLHPKLSPFIFLLPPHINIPQSLLLPVNRVTLQSAVASLPPDSSPSLLLSLSPVGKHDPCFDHPLVILSLLCPLNSSSSLYMSSLFVSSLRLSPSPPLVHLILFFSSLQR